MTYSIDLRQKIVQAYDRGVGSQRTIAQLFGVSCSFVEKLLARRRAMGDIAPLPYGGGRRPLQEMDPDLKAALEQLLDNDMAGNPMGEERWVRISAERLANKLKESGHQISLTTVWRMLKQMGLSLKANKKKIAFSSNGPEQDQQFQYIAAQRHAFRDAGLPIISVDTKMKESIGNFKNQGKVWSRASEEVYSHDFVSMAQYRAVPYGIYDVRKNKGYVFVGTSGDTPEFAADAIVRWWKIEGSLSYSGMNQLLILADSGGNNGCRVRGWKKQIQEKVSDKLGLTVTVCHYPPGCSKYNPVERRLFSFISINWAGKPLRSLELMLGYIRGTSTKTGLTVEAFLQEGIYTRGQKVAKAEMDRLNLRSHPVCPKWNYTITPRTSIN